MGIDWIEKFNLWDIPINTVCNQVRFESDVNQIVTEAVRKLPKIYSSSEIYKWNTHSTNMVPSNELLFPNRKFISWITPHQKELGYKPESSKGREQLFIPSNPIIVFIDAMSIKYDPDFQIPVRINYLFSY